MKIKGFLLFSLLLALISCKNELQNNFTPKLQNLTFNKTPGNYCESIDIVINSIDDATIFYTLDGSEPTKNSILYKTPITISEDNSTTTIKAIAIKEGYQDSEILTGTFSIKYEDITQINFDLEQILILGKKYQVNLEFFPRANPNLNIVYSSSNTTVANIDSTGNITPISKGTTIIKAEIENSNISYQKEINVYEEVFINSMIQNNDITFGPYEIITLNVDKLQLNQNCILSINSNVKLNGHFTIQTWGEIYTDESCKNICIDSLSIMPMKGNCQGIRLHGLIGNSLRIEQDADVVTYTDDVVIKNCIINRLHYQNVNGWDRTLDGTQRILIEQNIIKTSAYIMMYQGSGFLQENFLVQHNNFLGEVSVMNYYNNFTFIYNTFDYRKIEFGCNTLSIYSGDYDYSNNYWGTTDTGLIKSVLKDKHDDLTLPYEINYLPILHQPTELTPTIE